MIEATSGVLTYLQGIVPLFRQLAEHDLSVMRDLEKEKPPPASRRWQDATVRLTASSHALARAQEVLVHEARNEVKRGLLPAVVTFDKATRLLAGLGLIESMTSSCLQCYAARSDWPFGDCADQLPYGVPEEGAEPDAWTMETWALLEYAGTHFAAAVEGPVV